MKYLFWAIVIAWCNVCAAQKFDYTWLSGYADYVGYDTASQHWFGTSRFTFDSVPMQLSRDSLSMNFYRSNSTISDSVGNLLFYSNGFCIHNYLDQLIENGDSLAWGYFLSDMATQIQTYGEATEQFHTVIPNPLYPNVYDFFYFFIDSVDGGTDIAAKKLLRATLNMNANGGLGLVTKKDSVVFIHETDGAVTAVKHANGRDWWIVTPRTNTNCIDVLLYDGSDTITSTIQCGGDSTFHGGITSTCFSPDGSKFFLASTNGTINVFNFDRCSGSLNIKDAFIDTQIRDSTGWWPSQVVISPNSRFAYVFCDQRIFQFDLAANNIQGSKMVIAIYDSTDRALSLTFDNAQLGPDGKIYTGTENSNYYLSVIDSPDAQGASCNFLAHDIELPTWVMGLTTYCNWRLGPLSVAGCDSVTGINSVTADKEKELRVFPNPASSITTVDYGFTDWSKGGISLEILNALGQIIYTQPLPMYSGYQRLDISHYATGMYTVCIKRNGGVVATQKLVKSGP